MEHAFFSMPLINKIFPAKQKSEETRLPFPRFLLLFYKLAKQILSEQAQRTNNPQDYPDLLTASYIFLAKHSRLPVLY